MNNKLKAGFITLGSITLIGGLAFIINKYPNHLMNITLTVIGFGIIVWLYKLILSILENR